MRREVESDLRRTWQEERAADREREELREQEREEEAERGRRTRDADFQREVRCIISEIPNAEFEGEGRRRRWRRRRRRSG